MSPAKGTGHMSVNRNGALLPSRRRKRRICVKPVGKETRETLIVVVNVAVASMSAVFKRRFMAASQEAINSGTLDVSVALDLLPKR